MPSSNRADGAKTQLLDQTILQSLVHALDASLGLRRIGADDVDVQLGQRAAELCLATAAPGGSLVRHPENAVFVAIEGHRLSVATQVRHSRCEVVENRFGLHEAQLHQPARGVVDVHQQRAGRTALLKPRVRTAVDLDQLA